MYSNLLKRYYTSVQNNEVRVIDSNSRLQEKMQERMQENATRIVPDEPDEDGFSRGLFADIVTAEAVEAERVAELFAESEAVHVGPSPEELRMQAEREIDEMKRVAEVEMNQRMKEALEEARTRGYAEGLEKASREYASKERALVEKERKLEAAYEAQMEQMEPLLIEALTGVYEHIFNVELSEQQDLVSNLVASTLKKSEIGKSCIVHVSREDYPYVSMQKELIMSNVSSNTRLEIIEDMTLAKNHALIETEGGVIDCGLGTQLRELNRKIRLLSYEGSTKE